MSGICALVDFGGGKADTSLLARMMAAGAHRGPDGSHAVTAGSAALGHLALDTTDPVGPRQPLLRSGICLSADIRLDNREELIALLQGHGHQEVGSHSSDAELVLASYQCWGEECPAHLLGDFAFALWDARLRRLFCARDPLGIKPLCHARSGSWLCVASEAQQILAHPGVSSDLDEISLGRHLMGSPEPLDRTFFRAIQPVPPATAIVFDQEGQTARTFWSFQGSPKSSFRREDDAADCLLDILRQAVSARLRSHGPAVGVSLSGGLDSSSVAALARQTLAADRNLVGLTYTFDQLSECDEREHVRALAEKIDIESVSINAERHWFLEDSAAFVPSPESPFLGWESSYRAMLGELSVRRGRVLLTGHGADDLLGGSINVYADRFWTGDFRALSETLRLAPERSLSPIRALHRYLVRPLLPRRQEAGSAIPSWITPAFARRAGLRDLCSTASGWRRPGRLADDEIRERALQNRSYLRAVHWYDRRASSFGIEPRHPFLDRRLLEFVLALPPRVLFRIGSRKPLLCQALRGLLPERLLARRDKTRFIRFLYLSLRDKAAAQIDRLLEAPLSGELGILDVAQLRTAYQAYRTGQKAKAGHLLWHAVTLDLWLRRHHSDQSSESHPILTAGPALDGVAFDGERIAS